MAARDRKSKKRSVASSLSKPPEPPVFFLDRCLGRIIVAEALRTAGAHVEIHADHFEDDCPDANWLPAVGQRRWVVLTKDRHLRSNQVEIAALLASGTASFVLTAASLTGAAMASAFAQALPSMLRFLEKFEVPFVATISASGKVRMLYTFSGLIKRVQ
jgi:hypothetical protein